jgi:hypothetical protein
LVVHVSLEFSIGQVAFPRGVVRVTPKARLPSVLNQQADPYDKVTSIMVIPPGIEDASKYVARRLMRIKYSKATLAELILMSVTKEAKLSVTGNCIDPLSLDVKNSAPYEITVQATARVIANGTDIAETMVEESSQIIEKSKSKSFSIRPLAVSESGRQQVAAARSKAIISGKDYLDAVLSVKAVVMTWLYAEIQISRDLPLRIHLTN